MEADMYQLLDEDMENDDALSDDYEDPDDRSKGMFGGG